MALTKQQYESIIRGYELVQNRNRHLLEERETEIFNTIPEYHQLVENTGSLSVSYLRRLLESESATSFGKSIRSKLSDITVQKKALLKKYGYPENYLDPIYDCADCHDTGYLPTIVTDKPIVSQSPLSGASAADLHDFTVTTSRKCHCFRQKEISLLYEQSNIQEIIAKENFSTLSFEYYEGEDRKRFQEAVRISLDFVQNFEQDYHNLFFYGTVGTGKSFLSGCIAKELLQTGKSVIYFSACGLFDILARYSFDTKSKETLYNFYQDLYNCDLVIIDDLGTEITNSFVTSQLFGCLNERILRQKATIISTNLSLEELRDRYSDRIFSRITSNFTICKLSGPDIRIYKKRMRK